MKILEKFTRKERQITALHLTPQWIAGFMDGKTVTNTFVKKVFAKEKSVSYFISAINVDGKITVELSTPRGKLVANQGDWIVKEINNNYSVYSDKEFNKLVYHEKKNKK